jgi:hypothetical protein
MRFLIFAQRRDRESPMRCDASTLRELSARGLLAGFAVLSREDLDLCEDGSQAWLKLAHPQVPAWTLLVRTRPAPVYTQRQDQPIESFICGGPLCDEVVRALDGPPRLTSIYEVAEHVLASSLPVRIRALQVPEQFWEAPARLPDPAPRVSWVMPHAGPDEYLRSSLRGLAIANEPLDGTIWVGIDDPERDAHARLARGIARSRVMYSEPSGSGPYHIRNALVGRAEADIILFQDSDDVPCADRGVRLVEALAGSTHGTIGSHVVLVDTFERRVVPVRYPLDATGALRRAAVYSVLHPASAIRRDQFLRAGAFQTLARHSMDQHFLLRSHFFFTSANVDRFLYLRRRRAESLTTAMATKYGSLERVKTERGWGRDFEQVKAGSLPLEESSIRQRHDHAHGFTLREPWRTPHR